MSSAASFSGLYAQAAPALFAWANVRVHPALRAQIDPEDVLQEVCVRAFDRFDTFDPERGGFRNWLFGIANNVLKELLVSLRTQRREEAHPAGQSRSIWGELPDDATAVSRRVVRDEALGGFVDSLQSITDDERTLLVYRGLEGLRHAEIGELMGASADAIEKRWQRLLKKLDELGVPDQLLVR